MAGCKSMASKNYQREVKYRELKRNVQFGDTVPNAAYKNTNRFYNDVFLHRFKARVKEHINFSLLKKLHTSDRKSSYFPLGQNFELCSIFLKLIGDHHPRGNG